MREEGCSFYLGAETIHSFIAVFTAPCLTSTVLRTGPRWGVRLQGFRSAAHVYRNGYQVRKSLMNKLGRRL